MIERQSIKEVDYETWYWEDKEDGEWVNVEDCIIVQQDNMMMGDPLDNLNDQTQKQVKSDGIFDVMIIMRKKNEKI